MPTVRAGTARYPGGCLQPVLLRGRADYIDGGTGELLHRYTAVHEPGGVLPIACMTRRASRCPPCSDTYRADTYQLIRAGLTGGKGVPATVADHPCVFLTLTAPSFGPVHARPQKDGQLLRCRPRRQGGICPHGIGMSCAEKHAPDDDRLGEPLCPECYDYTGSVLFNAHAPELWRRFTITLRRMLARQAGLTNKALAVQVRFSYAKVAECTGTLDRRLTRADQLADLPVRDHARRYMAECLRLGNIPAFNDLRLGAWAHMLGFRGHFATKSRAYSTTMTALRADRAAHQREGAIAAGLLPDLDSDTTLVVNHWNFAGRGHLQPIDPLEAESRSHASAPRMGEPP